MGLRRKKINSSAYFLHEGVRPIRCAAPGGLSLTPPKKEQTKRRKFTYDPANTVEPISAARLLRRWNYGRAARQRTSENRNES